MDTRAPLGQDGADMDLWCGRSLRFVAGVVALASGPASAKPPPAPVPVGEEEALASRALSPRVVYQPGDGLTLRSAGPRFAVNMSAWAQILLTAHRDAEPRTVRDKTEIGLEIRRARLVFQGHAFSPHVHYYAHLMFSPRDLGLQGGGAAQTPIFQWYTNFTRFANANIKVGYFMLPQSHQRLRLPNMLQFIDNSAANIEFTVERDIGIAVSSPDIASLGLFRYYAGVFMGDGPQWYQASDAGFLYLGRVEVLPLGMFADTTESDFQRDPRPRLTIGAAYTFNDRDRRTRPLQGRGFADGGSANIHTATGDIMLKWLGLTVLGDIYWRDGRRNPGDRVDPEGQPIAIEEVRNGFGWTGQLGLLVPHTRFEAVARTGGIRPAKLRATTLARLDEVGTGLTYYFFRQALNLRLDYTHLWGPGLPAGRSDTWRMQLQFVF